MVTYHLNIENERLFRETVFNRKLLFREIQLKEAGMKAQTARCPWIPVRQRTSRLEAESLFFPHRANAVFLLEESSGGVWRGKLNM